MSDEQAKPRFSIIRVLTALFCIGLVLYLVSEGVLISWRPIVIREATAEDQIRNRYFGFDAEEVDAVRNFAVAEGTFSKDTWLSAWLYLVQSGKADEVNAFTVGRSPNRIGAARWINMRITLALGETKREGGRMTQLGSAGQSRGEGGMREMVHTIETIEKKTFPGRLSSGRKYILYVEGDRNFEVRRDMSVEEFAKANAGNFLVVVVELD